MKDIAIIIPIHELRDDAEKEMLRNALKNICECQDNYDGKLNTYIATPLPDLVNEVLGGDLENAVIIKNDTGKTDFCSQVNLGANNVKEEFFSILEFDDEYNKKWFSMVKNYYYTNEDVSLFLPINVQIISKEGYRQFSNEVPWAMDFSEKLGYIDFNCLKEYYSSNITGGVFNRNDFIRVGGLKPSIEVAFNYEFLLRVTSKKLKVFVVPKEGYKHIIDRDNSLSDICSKKFTQEEIDKWYALAHQEYVYDSDRGVTPLSKVENNQ